MTGATGTRRLGCVLRIAGGIERRLPILRHAMGKGSGQAPSDSGSLHRSGKIAL
jgi:hypothetical protein